MSGHCAPSAGESVALIYNQTVACLPARRLTCPFPSRPLRIRLAVTTVDPLGDDVSYRRLLGRYPTGVCIVTALPENSDPVGMVVGSFVSVSLDPPLVGFFPGRYSSTWPRIASAGRFCVNVLSQEQRSLCERFSSKSASRFDAIEWDVTPGGAPRFPDVMAWIDCDIFSATDAGDHLFVLGRVTGIAAGDGRSPLIFFAGGYGQFSRPD